MANENSTAIIQLPKGKKSLVSFGAIMLTVAVACYGLALMTLVPPYPGASGWHGLRRSGGSVHLSGYYPAVPHWRQAG